MTERQCEVEGCASESLVGYGNPVQWLCLRHYQQRLNDLSDTLRRLANGRD